MIKRISRKLAGILFNLTGYDVVSNSKIRSTLPFIRLGDSRASWVIPSNLLTDDSTCVLVGAGENISFDSHIANKYKSQVIILDPTPRAISYIDKLKNNPPDKVSNEWEVTDTTFETIEHLHLGLWKEDTEIKFYTPKDTRNVSHSIVNLQKTEDYFVAQVITLKRLVEKENIQSIDLLKIDIEGAEYEVIQSFVQEKIYPKVVCVEFDEVFNPTDSNYKQRIRNSITLLNSVGYIVGQVDFPGNYTFIHNTYTSL